MPFVLKMLLEMGFYNLHFRRTFFEVMSSFKEILGKSVIFHFLRWSYGSIVWQFPTLKWAIVKFSMFNLKRQLVQLRFNIQTLNFCKYRTNSSNFTIVTVPRFLAMTVFRVSLNRGSSVTLLKIPKLSLPIDEELQVRNRAFDVSVWHLNHNLWSLICNPLIPHVKYLLPQPYKGFFRCSMSTVWKLGKFTHALFLQKFRQSNVFVRLIC